VSDIFINSFKRPLVFHSHTTGKRFGKKAYISVKKHGKKAKNYSYNNYDSRPGRPKARKGIIFKRQVCYYLLDYYIGNYYHKNIKRDNQNFRFIIGPEFFYFITLVLRIKSINQPGYCEKYI
jgi:hypothetical protein